ncbi:MAG: protoporphyrinogen/coproporphyrinogen oxidase [Candidatus Binatia bacterium]
MPNTVILGAGLCGLSTAYHSPGPTAVFEKAKEPGGLCRSYERDGFTFDFTGHLLHFKSRYFEQFLKQHLSGRLQETKRAAYVFSHGVFTPYPFQANTYGLPKEIVKECVLGFIETLKDGTAPAGDFRTWILQTFGRGIAKHFMIPYNEKLWRENLSEMTADWVSWSVPKPDLEEVIQGALGRQEKAFGYNPTFLYPKRGGIAVLAQSMSKKLEGIQYGYEAIRLDIKKKILTFANGETVSYNVLISTIPLPHLLAMSNARGFIRRAAEQLKYIGVWVLNLGVAEKTVTDKHWIYFPERQFPFYRVGFPSNFSPGVAPKGCTSMYVEVSYRSDEPVDSQYLKRKILDDLQQARLLKSKKNVVVADTKNIPVAYVIFYHHRQRVLEPIREYLESHNIYSIGRYGRWDYFSMEDAIMDGRALAKRLQKIR